MQKRLHSIAGSVAITLATEMFVLLSFFILFRLISDKFGSEYLGLFALVKRIIVFAIPLVLLGLYDYLSRYLPMKNNDNERLALVKTGLVILVCTCALVMVAGNIDRYTSSEVLFGDQKYHQFVFPFTLLLVGLSIQTFVLAVLRGYFKIVSLNLLQLIAHGILPILLAVTHHGDFQSFLINLGVMYCVTPIIFIVFIFMNEWRDTQWKEWKAIVKCNLIYGIPRVPNRLIEGAFFALPPLIAANYLTMEEVGYLALALSLMIGVTGVITPLSMVLLPHLSSLVAQQKSHIIDEKLHILNGGIIQVLAFMSSQLIVHTDLLLTVWMGEEYLPAVSVVSLVLVAAVFYGFYEGTRSVLDAVLVRAKNTKNSVITICLLLIMIYFIPIYVEREEMVIYFAASFSLSMLFLALLTYYDLRKLFSKNIRQDVKSVIVAFSLNIPLIIFAYFLKGYADYSIISFILLEALLGIFYLIGLYVFKSEWVMLLKSIIIDKRME